MRHRHHQNLSSSQKSVGYAPYYEESSYLKNANARDYFRDLYPHMLIEDIHLGMMPYSRVTGKKKFEVVLTPTNNIYAELINKALPTHHNYQNLFDTIGHFIRDCAQTLIPFGKASYEIIFLTDLENAQLVGFELVYIPSDTLLQRHGKLVQYVPANIPTDGLPERYIELPKDSITHLSGL